MTRETLTFLSTLGVTAIFALIFYSQSWWPWPSEKRNAYRDVVSLSAGIAIAYVFMRLMPELAEASAEFVEATGDLVLPFPEYRVHGAALLGFLTFYALERLVDWSRITGSVPSETGRVPREAGRREERISDRVPTLSYALYVGIVTYVMAARMEAGEGRLALFGLSMGLHFLGVGYGLRREDEALYDGWGRHVLAASAALGWAVPLLTPLDFAVVQTLAGFVAGGVIVNTMIQELPGRKNGSVLFFSGGAILYAGVLLITD